MGNSNKSDNYSAVDVTAALATLQNAATLPGDGLPTPGAPGIVNIDEMDDNVGINQSAIGNYGLTDDLTLHL